MPPPRHILLAIALLFAPAIPSPAQSAEPAAARQVILLKLDDITQVRSPGVAISPRWQRVTDYLHAQKIKAGFGIICESLEKDNPVYFEWIKAVQASGEIEFWLHGYHLKTASEPGEFEHGTAEEQRAVLAKSEALAKAKLGFTLPAFGPHWSGTTDATDEALQAVPEIKIWLYGPVKPKFFTRMSLDRVLALENPTFVPDPVKFRETYERSAAQREALVLQGHPDQWDDKRWAGFQEIVEFLKTKNVEFLTPSEYLARKGGQK